MSLVDLADAFAKVERLPQHERLLIAVLLNDPPRWSAGSIYDPSVWLGFDSSIRQLIEEYRTGDRQPSVALTPFGRGHVLVAMGHQTAQGVIDTLEAGIGLIRQQIGNK
ncbi:hypothetical protein [Cupriavidus nantongensis]|uniref:Uncharacterized protein n=1 Tax=Cupriavidus nantongensis TaxID=1796606 RepID=A0A142JHY0_9BURK|nr:hypothetical protein [Cupriavidus nantongensis]AMR77692.1 hypothetical protein A2G96_08060 [Cupriavidus nantongensis]